MRSRLIESAILYCCLIFILAVSVGFFGIPSISIASPGRQCSAFFTGLNLRKAPQSIDESFARLKRIKVQIDMLMGLSEKSLDQANFDAIAKRTRGAQANRARIIDSHCHVGDCITGEQA